MDLCRQPSLWGDHNQRSSDSHHRRAYLRRHGRSWHGAWTTGIFYRTWCGLLDVQLEVFGANQERTQAIQQVLQYPVHQNVFGGQQTAPTVGDHGGQRAAAHADHRRRLGLQAKHDPADRWLSRSRTLHSSVPLVQRRDPNGCQKQDGLYAYATGSLWWPMGGKLLFHHRKPASRS